jgi:hypothetical protein
MYRSSMGARKLALRQFLTIPFLLFTLILEILSSKSVEFVRSIKNILHSHKDYFLPDVPNGPIPVSHGSIVSIMENTVEPPRSWK